MIYDNFGDIRDTLKEDLALEFWRKRNKDINIITETHIHHDQINHQIHIRINDWAPLFLYAGDNHKKRWRVLLHLAFEDITEVDTDQKGWFASFTVTPLFLMTKFSVFMPLQGIA